MALVVERCRDCHASGDDEVRVLKGLETFERVAPDADEVGGGAFDQLPEWRQPQMLAGSRVAADSTSSGVRAR